MSPQNPAGMRIEPPPSPAVARMNRPPATAAADPPDEPPGAVLSDRLPRQLSGVGLGDIVRSHGFLAEHAGTYHADVLRRVAFIQAAQRVGLTLSEIREALASLPDGRTPNAKDWAKLSAIWRPRLDAGCLSLATCALHNPGDRASRFGPGARYLLGNPTSVNASGGTGG